MARAEVFAAGAVLVLAAVAVHESGKLPSGTLHGPGPGFFPWWTSVALVFLALVLLIQTLVWRAAPQRGEAPGGIAQVVALLAVLGAYAFALEPVGFPLCTFLLVLFMVRVIAAYRWPLALTLAVLVAGGSYVVFAFWLKVPLPPGQWGG